MRYSYRRVAPTAVATSTLLGAICVALSQVQAAPYITVGPSDGFAFDQPRVAIAVVDPAAPGGPRNPEDNPHMAATSERRRPGGDLACAALMVRGRPAAGTSP